MVGKNGCVEDFHIVIHDVHSVKDLHAGYKKTFKMVSILPCQFPIVNYIDVYFKSK